MGTTNILDLNNRVSKLADGVTSVQGAVDEVVGKMGNMRMTKLWENPSPIDDFASQEISGLAVSQYDMLAVVTSDGISFFNTRQKGRYTYVSSSSSIQTAFSRTFTPSISNNKITITDCTGAKLTDGTSSTNNDRIIPLSIYGIKIVV